MIGLVLIMAGLTKRPPNKMLIILKAWVLAAFQETNGFLFRLRIVFFAALCTAFKLGEPKRGLQSCSI